MNRTQAVTRFAVFTSMLFLGQGGGTGASGNIPWKTTVVSSDEPGERLAIRGTVYRPDKTTPSAGVVMYFYQTDASGVYNKTNGSWQQPRLRGWIKTGNDGRYEIHTIKPGSYPGSRNPAHIHAKMSSGERKDVSIDEFLFEGDPFLSESEARKTATLGTFSNVMRITRDKDGVLQCRRDMIFDPSR